MLAMKKRGNSRITGPEADRRRSRSGLIDCLSTTALKPMKHLVLLLPLAACALAATVSHPAEIAHSVTIYRDTYGVPHIFGPTDASCVFGYAYAQAEDNFWQIEDSYMRALGRASEVYGKDTLDDDLVVRTLEIPRFAQAEYDHASPPIRELLDAFAQGLNYYTARHPQAHLRLLTHFE